MPSLSAAVEARAAMPQEAQRLAEEILNTPNLREAARKGVAQYTTNVDVEFNNVDIVLAAGKFPTRGIAVQLKTMILTKMQNGEVFIVSKIRPSELTQMVYLQYQTRGSAV